LQEDKIIEAFAAEACLIFTPAGHPAGFAYRALSTTAPENLSFAPEGN
jgi:hypothetical protein